MLAVESSGVFGVFKCPRNRSADSAFISRILAYSARKNKAKGPPAYSTLNPDTSSDSPSVKSNGARLVSANVEVYHMAAIGQAGSSIQIFSCVVLKVCRVKSPTKITQARRINARLTSYEMVWATARSAPINAYFEFDAQPEPRIGYTARLDKARMNNRPRFKFKTGEGMGIGAQRFKANVSASVGMIRNNVGEAVEGRTGSFVNSFKPSAIG